MKLRKLIQICGELLCLDLPSGYFEQTNKVDDGEVNKLLTCFECVYEELYRDYGTAIRSTAVHSCDGVIDISALRLHKVLSLVDGEGNDVPFRYSDNALAVTRDGDFNLRYARLPQEVAWDGEVVMPAPYIGERVVAYGVVREYLSSLGDWATAKEWDDRYKDALQAACGKTASMRMPARRWW